VNGKEVLVDLTTQYQPDSSCAVPLEVFALFLSELAHRKTGNFQLFQHFRRSLQDSRPHRYKLRLKPHQEFQQARFGLRKLLKQLIDQFAYEEKSGNSQQTEIWEFVDILKAACDNESRQQLQWGLHLLEVLGLLKIRQIEKSKEDIAMRISFKQQCLVTDQMKPNLSVLRQVERAAQRKLDLMKEYATAPQEQRQKMFRSYFFGEKPIIEPFEIDPRLTEEQRTFVKYTDGHHLIVGPAGSGKTRVLREHIRYLVDGKFVPPDRILVVTHFQSASDRIGKGVEDLGKDSVVKTMTLNSLGEFIFKQHRQLLKRDDGQPYYGEKQEISLKSEKDEKRLIQELLGLAFEQDQLPLPRFWSPLLPYPPLPQQDDDLDAKCLIAIALLRQQGIVPSRSISRQEIRAVLKHQRLREDDALFYYAIYLHHLARMSEKGWYSYDDQILFALALLQAYPNLIEQDQRLKCPEHIIIDEFQDLTPAQARLLRHLNTRYANVFAVGDDRQNIRTKEANSLNLEDNFKLLSDGNYQKHDLTTNFRSVQEILDLAYAVQPASHLPQRAARGYRGENPTLIRVPANIDANEHGDEISNHLLQAMVDTAIHHSDQLPPNDSGSVALIVSKKQLFERVQSYLQDLQRPFSLLSNTHKYQSFHAKRVLAYFRLILDKQQDYEMEFLLRHCLDLTSAWQQIKELKRAAQENEQTLLEALRDSNLLRQNSIAEEQIAKLQQHIAILDHFNADSFFRDVWQAISKLPNGPLTLADQQQEMTNLNAILKELGDRTVRQAMDYVDSHISFVEEDRPQNGLILTTIDYAKSQDFDTVFLLAAHLLRDRKRWYVSISRAKQRFFVLVDGNMQISQHPVLKDIAELCDELPQTIVQSPSINKWPIMFTSQSL
jgi:superfamily I DNA/RNA helicase